MYYQLGKYFILIILSFFSCPDAIYISASPSSNVAEASWSSSSYAAFCYFFPHFLSFPCCAHREYARFPRFASLVMIFQIKMSVKSSFVFRTRTTTFIKQMLSLERGSKPVAGLAVVGTAAKHCNT